MGSSELSVKCRDHLCLRRTSLTSGDGSGGGCQGQAQGTKANEVALLGIQTGNVETLSTEVMNLEEVTGFGNR